MPRLLLLVLAAVCGCANPLPDTLLASRVEAARYAEGRVLEVGVAHGHARREIRKNSAVKLYRGVDLKSSYADTLEYDVAELPFLGWFDTVYWDADPFIRADGAFIHEPWFNDPETVAEITNRHLRPGGRLIAFGYRHADPAVPGYSLVERVDLLDGDGYPICIWIMERNK